MTPFAPERIGTMRTHHDAKAMAKSLREALAEKQVDIAHSEALEIVARQFGADSWNILSAKIGDENSGSGDSSTELTVRRTVPIVRIFDVAKAREFYGDFLGFGVDWEHRFGDNFPLYMQVSRAGLTLHLSEHAGDATPGGNMVVYTTGLRAFQAELSNKDYRYLKPGLEEEDWGLVMEVTDPFNNRIRFMESP